MDKPPVPNGIVADFSKPPLDLESQLALHKAPGGLLYDEPPKVVRKNWLNWRLRPSMWRFFYIDLLLDLSRMFIALSTLGAWISSHSNRLSRQLNRAADRQIAHYRTGHEVTLGD